MQRISVTQTFSAPVERVYAHLAEHENLGDVFGARVRRVRDGHSERNGTGSVRSIKLAPVVPAFEEVVTQAVPNELIEYRITGGSPIKDHVGVVRFTPEGTGSRVEYTVDFEARIPGTGGLIKAMIEKNLRSGLAGVDRKLR